MVTDYSFEWLDRSCLSSCGMRINHGVMFSRSWKRIKQRMDFIPKGFLHGFLTLESDTEFLYKVSAPYSSAQDRSVRFDDPTISIEWPGDICHFMLSDKDRNAPGFDDAQNSFIFEAEH